MAPKQKQKREEEDVFKLEDEAGREQKPEKIDLWDTASLKRALDEAVIEAVHKAGHTIDNRFTDAKIALGLLACAIACLAQFYPQKYPASTWLLAGCVAAYMVVTTLMTAVALVFERDAIALTRAHPGGPPAVAITSRLPRFQEQYTLRIAPRGAPGATSCTSGDGGGGASLTRSVGAYFHADGHLEAEAVKRDVAALLARVVERKSQ